MSESIPAPSAEALGIDLVAEHRNWMRLDADSLTVRHTIDLVRRCHAAERQRDELLAALSSIISIQKEHYGHATNLHIHMIEPSDRARALIASIEREKGGQP